MEPDEVSVADILAPVFEFRPRIVLPKCCMGSVKIHIPFFGSDIWSF